MIKVAVTGDLKMVVISQLPKDFILDEKNPDIVLSFGGDGTFLLTENKYPGKPKLFIKHFWNCQKCDKHDFSKMFSLLSKKEYKILDFDKLEALVNNRLEFVAMNDINLHYIPPRAVRLALKINGKLVDNELIGDGFVVSTPFGSHGYFNSITRKEFSNGIGIAFNNPVKQLEPIMASNLTIEAKILRGPAVVVADCLGKNVTLNDKDILLVKISKEKSKVIHINNEIRFRDY